MMIFFIPLQFQELFAKHLDAGSPLEPSLPNAFWETNAWPR